MFASIRNLIFIGFLLASCANKKANEKSSQTILPIEASKKKSLSVSFLHQNHLKVAKNFAFDFQPDSFPYEGIGKLGYIPDSVLYAFKTLRNVDTLSHKFFLTIIVLKLELDHIRCCHQSYELRSKIGLIDSLADPLVYEYILATNLFDTRKPIESVTSALASNYVIKNKYLLENPEIKKLLNKMKPVEDSIMKGQYW